MLPRTEIRAAFVALSLLCAAVARGSAAPQRIVDRIAARVENDVILLSEVRELGAYQLLINGKKESDGQLLDRLIDQWIVRTEAEVAHFPRPAEADVDRELDTLKKTAESPERFNVRLRGSGLKEPELRRLVREQLFLANYLDSRFRPAVQIEPKAIEEFYEKTVVPLAKARGEPPPTAEAAREWIREVLVQRGINEQADRWLKESRARLHVEKEIP